MVKVFPNTRIDCLNRLFKMIRPEFRKKVHKKMTTIYARDSITLSRMEELLRATA